MQHSAGAALLKVQFADLATLRDCHMPYLTAGGLFIPGAAGYGLGDKLVLLLSFPGSAQPHMTLAQIVWINPALLSDSKPAGVGVQFLTLDKVLSDKIKTLVEGGAHNAETVAQLGTAARPQESISTTLQSATGLMW